MLKMMMISLLILIVNMMKLLLQDIGISVRLVTAIQMLLLIGLVLHHVVKHLTWMMFKYLLTQLMKMQDFQDMIPNTMKLLLFLEELFLGQLKIGLKILII